MVASTGVARADGAPFTPAGYRGSSNGGGHATATYHADANGAITALARVSGRLGGAAADAYASPSEGRFFNLQPGEYELTWKWASVHARAVALGTGAAYVSTGFGLGWSGVGDVDIVQNSFGSDVLASSSGPLVTYSGTVTGRARIRVNVATSLEVTPSFYAAANSAASGLVSAGKAEAHVSAKLTDISVAPVTPVDDVIDAVASVYALV